MSLNSISGMALTSKTFWAMGSVCDLWFISKYSKCCVYEWGAIDCISCLAPIPVPLSLLLVPPSPRCCWQRNRWTQNTALSHWHFHFSLPSHWDLPFLCPTEGGQYTPTQGAKGEAMLIGGHRVHANPRQGAEYKDMSTDLWMDAGGWWGDMHMG